MQPGAYYRSTDHINNFKVKVKLWRVSSNLPMVGAYDSTAEDATAAQSNIAAQDMEEYTFSWQEKIFSKKEIEYYEVAREYTVPIEIKYHEDVLKVRKNLTSYPRYLFTYVEADANRPTTTFSKPTTSDFVHPLIEQREALSSQLKGHPGMHSNTTRVRPFGDGEFGGTLRHRNRVVEFSPTQEFKCKRSHVLGAFQTMHIMANVSHAKKQSPQTKPAPNPESDAPAEAAVPLNEENKENKGDEDKSESLHEVLLCTIRFDSSSGLIIIKPDFNGSREAYEVPATVRSDSFQYRVTHCSVQMTAQDRERDRQTLSLIDAQRANLLRASVGPDFEIPFRDVFRLVAVGEILSASDFEYDSVYVTYSWDLPPLWTLAPRCPAGGVTPRCTRRLIDDRYVAYFSSPLELDAFYHCTPDSKQTVLRFPSLIIHVASLDSWNRLRTEGYGYVDIPVEAGVHELEANCWRPVGRSFFDEMRRFFVGSSPEVEDLTYTRVPSSFQGGRLSKLGFRVQTTGTVRIRLHVVQQAGEAGGAGAEFMRQLTGRQSGFIPDGQMAAKMQQRGLVGLSALSLAVQAVLDGYQKAKEKLSAAREGLPSHLRALLMLSAAEPSQQHQLASAASALLSSRMARAHGKKEL